MFDENNELKTNKNWIWESPPFLHFYFVYKIAEKGVIEKTQLWLKIHI